MIVAARTHSGHVRPTNQDTLIVLTHLFGVADGMGGHKGGEVASAQTAAVLGELLEKREPDAQLLEEAIQEANRRLYARQAEEKNLEGMGTTVTVLWEGANHVWIGHVGDSRAYLYQKGSLSQVTQDHSVVAEMIRQGILTKEKAKKHPYRNVITRAVGTAPTIDADVMRLDKHPGDIWLLCSDGLHGMVEEEDMAHLMEKSSLEEAAEALMQKALENGGRDNISLVLCRVTEVAQ